MPHSYKSDEEIIDVIVNAMFNSHSYQRFYAGLVENLFPNDSINAGESSRLWDKLEKEGWIEISNDGVTYFLSFKAREIIRKFGSYSNYIKQKVRKERFDNGDRVFKNIGIMVTLLISLLTLILSQCPIKKETEQKKTIELVQSIEKKLDSISRLLKQTKQESANTTSSDRGTDK